MAEADPILTELIERCRAAGMRRTHALEAVLRRLLESDQPLTATQIAETEGLSGQFDPATIYRMLQRLEDNGLLRRLGLRDRSSYYVIRHGHTHDDYIVCTECGSIQGLQMACPVEALEAEIATQTGFQKLDHELEFFGICPDCAKAA